MDRWDLVVEFFGKQRYPLDSGSRATFGVAAFVGECSAEDFGRRFIYLEIGCQWFFKLEVISWFLRSISRFPLRTHWFSVVWRLLNRLLTKLNLLRRNINLSNYTCPFCFNADETLFHLFYYCDVAQWIWDDGLAKHRYMWGVDFFSLFVFVFKGIMF